MPTIAWNNLKIIRSSAYVSLTKKLPQELCYSTNLEAEQQLGEVLTNIPESNHRTNSSDSENSDISILQKRKKLIEEK